MTITSVTDSNYLSPIRWAMVIDFDLRPVTYHCQRISLPSLSVGPAIQDYKQYTAHFTGDKIKFGPFTARFIILEDFSNYKLIFDWMISGANTSQTLQKDIILLYYTNSNNPAGQIKIANAIVTELTPVEFDTTQTSTEYLYADITFSTDYYQFVIE